MKVVLKRISECETFSNCRGALQKRREVGSGKLRRQNEQFVFASNSSNQQKTDNGLDSAFGRHLRQE